MGVGVRGPLGFSEVIHTCIVGDRLGHRRKSGDVWLGGPPEPLGVSGDPRKAGSSPHSSSDAPEPSNPFLLLFLEPLKDARSFRWTGQAFVSLLISPFSPHPSGFFLRRQCSCSRGSGLSSPPQQVGPLHPHTPFPAAPSVSATAVHTTPSNPQED